MQEESLFGGIAGMDAGAEPKKPLSNFMRMAVVCDVLFEPGNLNPEQSDNLKELIELGPLSDKRMLEAVPRNSIVIKEISGGRGLVSPGARLAFPLFAPHLMMPVKAGETVWIFDPTPEEGTDVVFWVCRIPTVDFVDDVCFTHHDRVLRTNFLKQEGKEKQEKPEFPNGSDDRILTLGGLPMDNITFDEIAISAPSNNATTHEPVPRFTARPGDMVLQGSNNALICLGQDRGFTHKDAPVMSRPMTDPIEFANEEATEASNQSNASFLPDGVTSAGTPTGGVSGKGTIDIVAGRGQAEGTEPEVIENEWEREETNKNPTFFGKPEGTENNLTFNPSEGDPDFYKDSSRVYVSMKTDGDNNFGLTYPAVPASTAGDFAGADVVAVAEKPYVILKSDEIRIIARQDDDTETQGSIKIVKEGVADDESDGKGRAVIILNHDGTIMIDGPKIVIGSGAKAGEKENGAGQQVSLGLAATEPIVLGQVLLDRLTALEKTFNDHIHNTGSGPSTKHHSDDGALGSGTISGEPWSTFLSKIGKTL